MNTNFEDLMAQDLDLDNDNNLEVEELEDVEIVSEDVEGDDESEEIKIESEEYNQKSILKIGLLN